MITMDITLLIQVVNMVVLMFLLNKVLYKPVKKILAERSEKLRGMRGDISKFEKSASQRQEELNSRMAEASLRAKAALDSARADAQAAGDAKLAEIKAEADSGKEQQLAEITTQIKDAQEALRQDMPVFASEMASKILGRSLTA